MSAIDIDDDVSNILSTLRLESNEDLTGLYYTLEDLYERKLWHQLTDSLDEFYHDANSKGTRLRLFNDFISRFYKKLNQVKFVEFLLLSIDEIEDNKQRLQYLLDNDKKIVEELPSEEERKSGFSLGLHESYNQLDDKFDAHIFLQISIARVNLYLDNFEDSRKSLDKLQKEIDALNTINHKINAAFYSTNAEFYKLKHDYNNFYRNTLLYLSSLDKKFLATRVSPQEKAKIAYELSIAALLGDDIYNFGELLLHDILNNLNNSEYSWLRDVLLYLNQGNLKQFHQALPTIEAKSPLLNANIHFLKQKICLMSLTESIFEKPNGKRILSFKEISENTLTSVNEVEFLVMRALSLGLIKGFIDQINQTVTVSWVQPRIMNKEQTASMKDKLVNWSSNVDKLSGFVEHSGEGIWSEA